MSELGLSKDDIVFLKELQHEMITQDHVGQAAPRFWVVRGTEKTYWIDLDECDGVEMISEDECETVADGIEEIVDYLKENMNLEEYYNIKLDTEYGFELELEEKEDRPYEYITTFNELADFIKNNYDGYYIVGYKNMEKNYDNTFFLTNRECKNHISANYYHYSDDAHSYAMTAWRAPEVSRLWNILDKINWDKVETLLSEDECGGR